jgi:hypothetical protein
MEDELTLFKIQTTSRTHFNTIYQNVPHACDVSNNDRDFFPVDTHFHEKGISIVGDFPRQASASSTIPASHMLKEAHQNLHPALRSICGKISFPPDDGTLLTQTITESYHKLFAASDASYKEGRATHAWIISTGKIADITNPWFNIHGSGPVHELSQHLSSTRGELQGITSFTIMLRLFFTVCNSSCSISAICDNRGVIHKCTSHKKLK